MRTVNKSAWMICLGLIFSIIGTTIGIWKNQWFYIFASVCLLTATGIHIIWHLDKYCSQNTGETTGLD